MIVLRSTDPQGLLDAIYAAIKKGDGQPGIKTKERVITWGTDDDKFLHHDPDTSNDWASKARFEPRVYKDKGVLAFFIRNPKAKDGGPSHAIYAIYHGRFLGMLISHFPDNFTVEDVTTRPFTGDWKEYYATL